MCTEPEHYLGENEINLKTEDGRILPAIVDYGWRDCPDENRYRHTKCRIKLKWSEGEIEQIAIDFFTAFCQIREQLDLQGLLPMCYGASRRVIITGMARDMGMGLKVYKVQPDGSTSIKHLAYIFDCGPDVEPVPVEVQQAFQHEWFRSARSHSR